MRRALTVRVAQLWLALFVLALLYAGFRSARYQHLRHGSRGSGSGSGRAGDDDGSGVKQRTHKEALKDVRRFWFPIQKAITDAKPFAEHVALRDGGAPRVRVKKEDEPIRAPGKDYVEADERTVEALTKSHKQYVEKLEALFDNKGALLDQKHDPFEGDGVVMLGGGVHTAPAVVSILMLRKTGSQVPIELFFSSKGEYEEDLCTQILPLLKTTCVIIDEYLKPEKGGKIQRLQYEPSAIKSLAILFSSFQRTLFLEAETIPLQDPSTDIFPMEPFQTTGLISFPDTHHSTESPLFYTIAGLPTFPDTLLAPAADPGQLLIDKSKHLKTLLLAVYYNIHGPQWYYPLLAQGHPSAAEPLTYEAAATALGLPWYRVQSLPRGLGRKDAGKYRASGLVHYNPTHDLLRHGAHIAPLPGTGGTPLAWHGSGAEQKLRPLFIRAVAPAMNAGRLVDSPLLRDSASDAPIRMWGDMSAQRRLFGSDVERVVFRYVIETGCKYVRMVRDWQGRDDVCQRLMVHYRDLFFDVRDKDELGRVLLSAKAAEREAARKARDGVRYAEVARGQRESAAERGEKGRERERERGRKAAGVGA